MLAIQIAKELMSWIPSYFFSLFSLVDNLRVWSQAQPTSCVNPTMVAWTSLMAPYASDRNHREHSQKKSSLTINLAAVSTWTSSSIMWLIRNLTTNLKKHVKSSIWPHFSLTWTDKTLRMKFRKLKMCNSWQDIRMKFDKLIYNESSIRFDKFAWIPQWLIHVPTSICIKSLLYGMFGNKGLIKFKECSSGLKWSKDGQVKLQNVTVYHE